VQKKEYCLITIYSVCDLICDVINYYFLYYDVGKMDVYDKIVI